MGALQNMRRQELRKFDGELPDSCLGWTKLEEVTLESCRNLRRFPASRIETLTNLTMRCCPLHPQFDLIFASQLRHVTIESLTSGVSLESLSHLTSLEQLDVKYGTGSFPVGLFALPSLTFVKLGYVKWMEGGDTHWDWDFERDGYIYPAAEKAAAAIAARDVRYPPLGRSLRHLDISIDEGERTVPCPV
ncbi:unnamed protein product [Closterium sp. NIES-53]